MDPATLALTAAGLLAMKALEAAERGSLVAQPRRRAGCRPRTGTDRRGQSVVTAEMSRAAPRRSPWPLPAPGWSPGPPSSASPRCSLGAGDRRFESDRPDQAAASAQVSGLRAFQGTAGCEARRLKGDRIGPVEQAQRSVTP
jgi:hypothetical protein